MLTYILLLLCLPPLCAILALVAGFNNNILHWLHPTLLPEQSA